jgi:hypothetical protein
VRMQIKMSHGRPMLLLLVVATVLQAAAQHGFWNELSSDKHIPRPWSRSKHRTRRVLEEPSNSTTDASNITAAPINFTIPAELTDYTVNYTLKNLRGTEISSSLVFVRMDELKEQCKDMAKRAAQGGGKKVLIVPTIHWSGNEQTTESWCYRTGGPPCGTHISGLPISTRPRGAGAPLALLSAAADAVAVTVVVAAADEALAGALINRCCGHTSMYVRLGPHLHHRQPSQHAGQDSTSP